MPLIGTAKPNSSQWVCVSVASSQADKDLRQKKGNRHSKTVDQTQTGEPDSGAIETGSVVAGIQKLLPAKKGATTLAAPIRPCNRPKTFLG